MTTNKRTDDLTQARHEKVNKTLTDLNVPIRIAIEPDEQNDGVIWLSRDAFNGLLVAQGQGTRMAESEIGAWVSVFTLNAVLTDLALKQYQITSMANVDHGIYPGQNPAQALLAFHRDNGHDDHAVWLNGNELAFRDAETFNALGDVEDWVIEEVTN